MEHLTVLSPEVVAFHIEGIAACLGPSTADSERTLPLNAAECPQLPFAIVAGNEVVLQDDIQLPCRPFQVALWGYLKLLPKGYLKLLPKPFVSDLATQQHWYRVY